MKTIIAGTLLVTFALTGCAFEDSGADPADPASSIDGDAVDAAPAEATGTTTQAVSSFGIWSWGCSSGPCALDLGPSAGQTCFLAGVWGNLQHAGTFSQAQVVTSGGRWGIQVVHNGHPLGVTAVCVPGTTVRTASWQVGQAEVNLGSGATRRCFLSGIFNQNGFTSAADFVQVRKVGSTWFLGGNMVNKQVRATAVCVDVASAAPDFGLVAGEGSSFLNVDIQSNNPGGWACGFKKLGGHFTSNDFNDGVWISYNNGISEWQLNAVNGKQVTTDCVK